MKIAVLCHMHHPISEPFEGGTEAHTAMIADGLIARGHSVTLFAKEGSQTQAELYPLVPKDFEFVHRASPMVRKQQKGFLAEAVFHSIDVIRQSGFDVVVNNSLSSLPYTFMRDLRMMTVLHTPPTLEDVTAVVSHPEWEPTEHHSYVTVSHTNAASWRALLPSTRVILNGVDLSMWNVDGAPRPDTVVWAARITPEKGLHIAIDAARAAGMAIEFAGPISHPEYFHEQIEPRLGDMVRYVGHLSHSQLPEFIASGAVFVASPLWAEPFGLSVVEAMATGTPVAALPNGALPELVTATAGRVSRLVSVRSLAAAIRAARTVERDGVRHNAARYSLDHMLDEYETELMDLAGSMPLLASDAAS